MNTVRTKSVAVHSSRFWSHFAALEIYAETMSLEIHSVLYIYLKIIVRISSCSLLYPDWVLLVKWNVFQDIYQIIITLGVYTGDAMIPTYILLTAKTHIT